MRFDRRVSEALVGALLDGPLDPLRARAIAEPLLDLQLRTEGTSSRATWYEGLTAILVLDERSGRFRLDAHARYQAVSPGLPWKVWLDADRLDVIAAELALHLEAAAAEVDPRFTNREGLVSASLASNSSPDYRLIQREALPAFTSAQDRATVFAELSFILETSVRSAAAEQPWWPGIRDRGLWPKMGAKIDAVAVDQDGRLLVIEAKAADNLKGIVFAPVQVRLYHELVLQLASAPAGIEAFNGMLDQRVQLGLTASGVEISADAAVVPVVAIGPGSLSSVALDRMAAVANALPQDPSRPPLEVWLIDGDGHPVLRWRPELDSTPPTTPEQWKHASPVPTGRGFVGSARAAAIAWKHSSSKLPADALLAAPYAGRGEYDFCLPLHAAELNLIESARSIAVARFAACAIPWHRGVDGGPTNLLLSSQIQCANALAPFVGDPTALKTIFGDTLDIAEVLPFGARTSSSFDASDHVVFEWIGLKDYLGERHGGTGTRGANNTSADAAIRYRTTSGRTEIALIEWKYTEQYLGHELSGGAASNEVRKHRYRDLWEDPRSPVRTDVVPYGDLFVEPLYQLLRLQLLAWQMELARELDAERVRLVYVAPSANAELWRSLNRASHRQIRPELGLRGSHTVLELWRAMLRRPDRFAYVDSATLVDPSAPSSEDFKLRYAHLSDGTRSFDPPVTAAERFVAAAETARAIGVRVLGEGSVLERLLENADLASLDASRLDEASCRLEELAELARTLRADVLHELDASVDET